ncbi:hypothetical protein C7N43_00185 [Sphingobacteriales bacterium UPWRP_1]|nr:hypothetical protein BVG80_15115 [Sphingobacteriales bacterium TSM_CSM]PSJ79079.1 hypothetical protein C7N43_00185 [Sphingobacteriales bacterium UPWRP_1]
MHSLYGFNNVNKSLLKLTATLPKLQHYGRFFLIFFDFNCNGNFFSGKSVLRITFVQTVYKTETAIRILNRWQKLVLFNCWLPFAL